MPQYGGGVGFSKMKKKLDRSKKKKRSRINKKKQRIARSLKRFRSKKNKIKTPTKKDKVCGCGTHKYTGKESSPRGLGKCEECIPLNVMLRGKDGDLYENKGNTWIKL